MPQTSPTITTMHTAYYYNANGQRDKEAGAASAYEVVNNYGVKNIDGKRFYQVSQDGSKLINANNVDGLKREMLNDAQIYNSKGNVISNSETLEAGSIHTTYGKPLYLNGRMMYRVGKGQYINKDDAGKALGYGEGTPENHIKSKEKSKSAKKTKPKTKGKTKSKAKGKVRSAKGKKHTKSVKGKGKKHTRVAKGKKRPAKHGKKLTAEQAKYEQEITADMQNATADDIKNNRLYLPNLPGDGGKDKVNGRGFDSGYSEKSDLADYIDPNTHQKLDPNMGRYYATPKIPSPTGNKKQYYFDSLQAAEKEANLNAPNAQDRGMLIDLWAPGAANDPRYNHGGVAPTDNSLQQAAQAGNNSELQGINIAQINPSLAQANAANPTGPQLGA